MSQPTPPGTPQGPWCPGTLDIGTATYGRHPRCQYCGAHAEIWDIDGSWCTPEHQHMDRGAETTWWRKAVTA